MASGKPCDPLAVLVPLPHPARARSAVAAQTPPNTLESYLAKAKADYDRDPSSADNAIWLGRRLAYLGRFSEAIDTFTQGILKHPGDARLYRHRGHRYITLRKFDLAIRDLKRAADLIEGPDQIEPDGQPNARNIPTSTLDSNIYYHLGLAHYLKGEPAADWIAHGETYLARQKMLKAYKAFNSETRAPAVQAGTSADVAPRGARRPD